MKLGPHIQNFDRLDLKALLAMRPPILKTLQASPHLCEYKGEVGGLVIARSYVPTLDRTVASGDATALAGKMRDALLAQWRAQLYHVDYFELVNESAQTGDALKNLTEFTVEACRLLHAEGHKVAVGSFSVGNPPNLAEDWRTFEPAVRAADAVALHEYGAPNLWSQIGSDRAALSVRQSASKRPRLVVSALSPGASDYGALLRMRRVAAVHYHRAWH